MPSPFPTSKRPRRRIVLPMLLGLAMLAPGAALAAACRALPIDEPAEQPDGQTEFRVGPYRIRLPNEGRPPPVNVWEGPMEVEDLTSGRRCTINPDMMGRPLVAFEGGLLVVPNHSGSNDWVSTLDLARCTVRHVSRPASGMPRVVDGVLRIGRVAPAGLPCDRIAPSAPPVRLERSVDASGLRYGRQHIRVDDVRVHGEDAAGIRLVRRLALGNAAFAILAIETDDAACPLRYRVLDVSAPPFAVSPRFGNCAEMTSVAIEGTTLRVSFGEGGPVFSFAAGRVDAPLPGMAPEARPPSPGPTRQRPDAVIARQDAATARCDARGGAEDEARQRSCGEAERLQYDLLAMGWCSLRRSDDGRRRTWHLCDQGSLSPR